MEYSIIGGFERPLVGVRGGRWLLCNVTLINIDSSFSAYRIDSG